MSDKGLWGSMVSLNQVVTKAVQCGALYGTSPEALEAANDLDVALQRHRSTFISLLRNPHKNATERSTLQRAIEESVTLPGYTTSMKLPEAFVQEALIIADMFDISEMSAFSLLKAAEEEKTLYPGIPRGLVAVLFYYDSREQLANAFKTLVQARQGLSWTLLPKCEELSCTITQYLDPILNTSIVDRILHLIKSMEITKEIDLLQKNRALGNAKHKSMVIEKFKSVRSLLAETLFCWAAQTPLKRDECKRLIAYLSKVKLGDTRDGSLSQIDLVLLITLLYSIDASYLLAVEDITESIAEFPITNDPQFVPEIHSLIKDSDDWECDGLLSIVQLAWSVTLNILRQVPIDTQIIESELLLEEDQLILDLSLKQRPFHFLEKCIFVSDNLPLESFHAQKFHNLLTDFICHAFDKVKILKTMADENARKVNAHLREGLDPPTNLEQPYEELLSCLAVLYENGQCGDSVEEYWYDHLYSSTPFRNQSLKQVALYRFVRLPGDFLPPSLFVPYLRFLTGISTTPKAAQSVYNFLRMNSQPGSHGSNLSWENFLNAFSQYYQNLRLQHPQSMHDTVYQSASRSTFKYISPHELKGLVVVLQLVKEIALNDESARVALCNHSAFSPIFVFVGLLACNVPLSLKSWLIKTLASFSYSPILGGKIWQAIEGASLVPSSDGTPGYANRGLRQDIEEVESRCEEFPLSQSFLELLSALIKTGIPYQAGNITGHGFRPCLELVKKQVFLPHDSRTYKSTAERWILCRKCIELFLQLLNDYQPPPSSLGTMESWNHPSHLLLVELVQDSLLLRQLFSVLHDAVQILEQHNKVPGQSDAEASLLGILKIILSINKLQRFAFSRASNKGDNLLMGIERLLTSLNPRSGSCDHMLNISLILGHHVILPQHASLVCQILTVVCSSPSGQNHVLPLVTTPALRGLLFRQNFVQVLDHANLDDDHLKAAETALDLLKSCLRLPAPNLAHFLLGFTDGSSIGSSELRSDLLEPGVRGFPRTALHAVLAILPSLPTDLRASAYNLIFILTSSPSTSAATLRYLSSHDFVHQSLSSLPLSDTEPIPSKLYSIGWVLQIGALDLRYHSLHKQRSQLRRLINLLVSVSEIDSDAQSEVVDVSLAWNGLSQEGRGILFSLFEFADLNIDLPKPIQCQFLNRATDLLKLCEENVGDQKLINVAHLHQMIHQLMQTDAATTSANDPINTEIQNVLDHAIAVNQSRQLLSAQRHFFESWRQLVEVVVSVSPSETSELASHQVFLHTITLELIRKLLDESALPELSSILVSTLLLLVTTMRTLSTNKSLQKQGPTLPTLTFSSSLQLILRGIIDCVLRFKQSNQSVRASLYATLLNYLRIQSCISSQAKVFEVTLSLEKETPEEQFHRENYEAIRENLVQLIDILSYEASAGHLVCRLLSMTCLDAIAALERRSSSLLSNESPLLNHLSGQGHLRILLDGISADDQNIIGLIVGGDQDLRPLYLWETRAALLARLALTPNGSRLLLQFGLLTSLSEMEVFKYHPSDSNELAISQPEADNSAMKIYRGAIAGAIRICMAVLTSLGPEDNSAVSQILCFLSTNVEALTEMMRTPGKSELLESLNHMALLTSIISVSSPQSLYIDQKNPSALEIVIQTKRLRKQLIFILPQFKTEGSLFRLVDEMPLIDEDGTCVRERARTFFFQILTNSLFHARDILLNDDAKSSEVSLIFQPSVDMSDSSNRTLSLGTLLSILDSSSQEFMKSRNRQEEAHKNLTEIDTAHFDSLHQFVSPAFIASASPSAVRKLAAIYLGTISKEHKKQEELAVHSVEACMLLLYRHLVNYLSPRTRIDSSHLQISVPLTENQILELKNSVRNAFEQMICNIQQVERLYSSPSGHVPFLEGCITKIRWLLAS